MPGIVGTIKIVSVSSGSIVHIGDAVQLNPQSTSKTFAGAGSFNTGDHIRTFNTMSATNTWECSGDKSDEKKGQKKDDADQAKDEATGYGLGPNAPPPIGSSRSRNPYNKEDELLGMDHPSTNHDP